MNDQEREEMERAFANRQEQHRIELERTGRAPRRVRTMSAALASELERIHRLHAEGDRPKSPPVPEVSCRTCLGARHVMFRPVSGADPYLVRCPECWDKWYAEQIRRRWPLSDGERALGKKSFRRRPDAPEIASAYRAVVQFARDVDAGSADMLSITGSVGIGKTHLGMLLYSWIDAKNLSVIYRSASRLRDILQDFGYDDDASKREADRRRQTARTDLENARLLIIDEAEKGWSDHGQIKGEYFRSVMLDILNERRNHRRATMLIGNNLSVLPAPILSRANASGNKFIALDRTPDARPTLEGI
jgi:hypothetical protein